MGQAHRGADRGAAGPPGRLLLVVGVLTALLGTLVSAPGAARPPPTGTDAPTVTAAHLRVVLETSSAWAGVRLRPGRVVTWRALDRSPGARLRHEDGGWRLRPDPSAGQARAVIDLVLHEPAGVERIAVELRKGITGAADVTVTNRNATADRVVTLHNGAHRLLGDNVRRARPRRGELLGDTPLGAPTATGRRLVLAFYYGWFRDYDRPGMTDRPADPRSTRRAAGVRSMTRQASGHGIDGFIVSWAGTQGDRVALDRAVAAAEAEDQLVTGYLETRRVVRRDGAIVRALLGDGGRVERVRRRLGRLLDRADSPAFLRSDGIPVVFVYGMSELTPDQWRRVLRGLDRRGKPVRLVGDAGPGYRSVAWGRHRYSPLGDTDERAARNRSMALSARAPAVVDPGTDPQLFAATVAPGFDDHKVRPGTPTVERDGGRRYARDWRAALSASPDWVLVTSWNEWFEATSVEPSARFGDTALDQTARFSTRWRAP